MRRLLYLIIQQVRTGQLYREIPNFSPYISCQLIINSAIVVKKLIIKKK